MASIRSYFMAKFYDATMEKSERLCLGQWRKELLADVSGDILEIGSGTGVTLPLYQAEVSSLTLSEPDQNMRRQLEERVSESDRADVSVTDFGAESIGLPNESLDYVVTMLVLCSVGDQAACLAEAYRLLRPGGRLVFLEHVVAKKNATLKRWQKLLQPFWIFMCGNCHLTYDTETAIKSAGFRVEEFEEVLMMGAPPVVQPMIKGVARKPG